MPLARPILIAAALAGVAFAGGCPRPGARKSTSTVETPVRPRRPDSLAVVMRRMNDSFLRIVHRLVEEKTLDGVPDLARAVNRETGRIAGLAPLGLDPVTAQLFLQMARSLETRSARLVEASRLDFKSKARQTLGRMTKTCNRCHDRFRK